ncbi:hypothetical protein N7540_006162 [Penicillium herquei]|nr:hypothetical protein N7540_006162 [Penicillium herquei]
MASRSPTAATPLPKSSVAPESPSKDATASPQTVPFPSPQTFEIIPPLHGTLLRLLSHQGASNGVSGAGEASGAPGASSEGHQQDQQASSNGTNGGSTSQAVAGVPLDPNAHPPLDVKDLPTETSSVKIRIQKARAVVEGLPDIDRSVEEQEEEIAGLQDQVSRLEFVISDLKRLAALA